MNWELNEICCLSEPKTWIYVRKVPWLYFLWTESLLQQTDPCNYNKQLLTKT